MTSRKTSAFTLVEVVVTLTLFVLLSAGVLAAITTFHKMARSQATYNSAFALVIREQDALRAEKYAPPQSPFTNVQTSTTTTQSVSSNASSTAYLTEVTIVREIEPVSTGHLVTISANYIFQGRNIEISTTTVINKYSTVDE